MQTLSSLTRNSALQELREPAGGDQALAFYDPAEPSDPTETATALTSTSLSAEDPFGNAKSAFGEARSQPWAIPESVYFVYRGHRPDGRPPRQPPVATAFVLSVRVGPDHDRNLRFLVTARHVVDPQWARCSEQNPASIDLRLNRRSGGVGYEAISLLSGTTRGFYTPLDPTADIAVIPLDQSLIPAINDYKVIDVPFHLLLTDAELPFIRADQQVMTARPSGTPGSYPLLDGGVLSTMPSDPVGVQCGILKHSETEARTNSRMLHVWFINAGVAQGVSGAPVYTSIARGPGSAETRVLLGVQSVAWPDKGITGMTPSPVLGDLIRSALRERKLKVDFAQRQTLSRTTPPLY